MSVLACMIGALLLFKKFPENSKKSRLCGFRIGLDGLGLCFFRIRRDKDGVKHLYRIFHERKRKDPLPVAAAGKREVVVVKHLSNE